jgi:hypothetical protein
LFGAGGVGTFGAGVRGAGACGIGFGFDIVFLLFISTMNILQTKEGYNHVSCVSGERMLVGFSRKHLLINKMRM